MERWIAAGRVTVNGEVAQLGGSLARGDRVTVDGTSIATHQLFPRRTRVLALHKPAGVICSRSDREQRQTVFELLPEGNWVAVGRLDINTTGLLLFTNNGDLANRLMHPSHGFLRRISCACAGRDHGTLNGAITHRRTARRRHGAR